MNKDNKRYFYASSPENLLKNIDEKRNMAEKLVKELKKITVKPLKDLSVEVYEGKDSIKNLIRQILGADEFFMLGGGGRFRITDLIKFEMPHYLKELNLKKIKGKIITSPDNKKELKETFQNSNVEIKLVEKQESKINFIITKKILAIYSSESFYVIKMTDENISKSLKMYFDLIWNSPLSKKLHIKRNL